jgi:hypothetical protein
VSYLSELDSSGFEQRNAEDLRQAPPPEEGPGFFTGALKGPATGLMRGFTNLADTLSTVGGVVSRGEFDDETTQRADEQQDEMRRSATDFWTPDARTVGTAGRVLGGAAEGLAPLVVPIAGPALTVGTTTLTAGKRAVDEGVDLQTAQGLSTIEGVASYAGLKLPILGNNLTQRLVTGAVGNLALGTGSTAAERQLLNARGYEELAKNYDPLDVEARSVDLISGLVFGGLHHVTLPSERGAVATMNNAKHFQQDTAPGIPADASASAAHQRAMETATEQLLRGEPVSVDAAVTQATFHPRTGDGNPIPDELKALDPAPPAAPPDHYPATDLAKLDVPDEVRGSLEHVYQQAAEVKPEFDAAVRDISNELGTPHEPLIPETLKGVDRAAEKTLSDYGGDASKLKDLVRATIVVDDLKQAARAVDLIEKRFGTLRKYRNMLDENVPSVDGYRDINTNVMVNGHVTELQVNVPEMVKAKDELHSLYEERRVLSERVKKADHPSAEDFKRINDLNDQMSGRYAAAWKDFLSRSKDSAVKGVPSEKASESLNGRPSGSDTSNARMRAPPEPSGSAATGTPSTSQNTGSLPRTSRGVDIEPPAGGILPRGEGKAGAQDISADDPVTAAVRNALEVEDMRLPTGEIDADGNAVTISAREALAQADAAIAEAQNLGKGIAAAVSCFLTRGV